ncbi:MAG: carbon-nitrogen hydrolase family protein [Pirellulales bacterium]
MSRRYRAAVVQLQAGSDKLANLEKAEKLVAAAADAGAKLIALPEMFNLYGPFEPIVAAAETVPGPTSDHLAQWAVCHDVFIVGGSFAECDAATAKARNTSLLFAPDGRILARYCKVHLFDIDLPGRVTSKESDWITAGCETTVAETPLGKIGQAICYDLRFPELFRRLSAEGAEIIVVPSAFTHTTGRDHWEILVRARAIENQCYVLAPNQCGEPAPGMRTYGHSLIVDPWGRVLSSLDEKEGFAVAELDLESMGVIRSQLPAHAHRRL